MSEEERKRLCKALREAIAGGWFSLGPVRPLTKVAADEIERLAKRVADSEKEIEDIGDEIRRTVGSI